MNDVKQAQRGPKRDLVEFAKNEKITRRDFMQYAAAIGITASAATSLWSARAEAAPKRGGHLRIGCEGGATTDNLDTRQVIGSTHISAVAMTIFDALTEINADGVPVPNLCESWEASADAKTWRFKIRKDVEFHNGKTMTVDDILSSYNYEDHDANTHGDSRSIMATLSEKKKDGDYLVLKMDVGNADLPAQLSTYGLLIGPEGTEGDAWNKGIGTGPYKLKSFNAGVRADMERFENHFRDDLAWVDSAEFINIPDQASRSNALRTGVVDIINRPDPKTTHLLAKEPGVKVVEVASTQHYTMPMRADTAPFDNVDVRQAVKNGVDREAILDKILRGYGYLGNDHPIGKGQAYFNKDLPQRVLDPDKAKFHVKKAGLSELNIELFASDAAWTGAVDAAQLVQEGAKAGGINIKINRVPADGYWTDVWLVKPWCLSYWGGRPTEDWIFTAAYSADSAWNAGHWKHERFNQILLQARGELDADKRHNMYYEMQAIMYNEGSSVIPVFSSYVMGMTDKLQHPKLSSVFDLDTFRVARSFWFES